MNIFSKMLAFTLEWTERARVCEKERACVMEVERLPHHCSNALEGKRDIG